MFANMTPDLASGHANISFHPKGLPFKKKIITCCRLFVQQSVQRWKKNSSSYLFNSEKLTIQVYFTSTNDKVCLSTNSRT